jgi:polyisoprenoid-binding protein YceI
MATPLRLGLCAALVAFLPCAAAAAVWQGDQNSGALRFVATQAGAKFQGHFGEFKVRFDFDPAAPAKGRLDVTIATRSADTADAERDDVLHGTEFFSVVRFPESTYHAEEFTRDGKGWKASGQLTLRGVTKKADIRFELEPSSSEMHMRGDSTVHRLEFGVGQGDWADTTWLGDAVDVSFDLSLRPAAVETSP